MNMKKILFVLLACLIPILGTAQSNFKRGISVGITDSIAPIDSIIRDGSIVKVYSDNRRITESDVVSDSITGRIAAGIDIEDLLEDFEGGGGGTSWDIMQFTVDVTDGAPASTDTIFDQTVFIGQHIGLYRDGARQTLNTTATNTKEGFRVNNTTGRITVLPAFQANEKIIIAIDEPISYTYLAIEGEESTLLDSLLVGFKFDETAGTLANDVLAANNGTINGVTVNQTGQHGKAYYFDAATDDVTVPNDASLYFQKDEMTVALWVYLDDLPSTLGRDIYAVFAEDGDAPYSAFYVGLMDDTDYVRFAITNTGGTQYSYETANASLTADTWIHICCVNEGHGSDAKVYINGSDVTSWHPTEFSGEILQYDSALGIGNSSSTSSYAII